jgi:hypothetical protein
MFRQAKSTCLNNKQQGTENMSTAQKSKGNTGERKIADFLGKLYEAKFIRVPNSGAFLGGKNNHRAASMDAGQIATFKADLIPPTHMQRLVIESKFYAEFPFHALLKNEDIAILDKWIEQARIVCDPQDFWVVVFRINRRGVFAAFDAKHLGKFTVANHSRYKEFVITEFEKLFTDNRDAIAQLSAS